jgi:hypothetical protein
MWSGEPSHSPQRADDYAPDVAAIVCKFQKWIESNSGCDYPALRAALSWARQTSQPVTMSSLIAAYCRARSTPRKDTQN